MPVLPAFEPSSRPGELSSAIEGAGNASESWMNSAQTRRLRAAQDTREQQQFDIMKPVMEAKAKADVLQQLNAVDGQEKTEEARGMAYTLLPQARKDFDEMLTLKDPEFRVEQARAWLGNYAQLDQVQELSAEMKQRKDVIANMLTEHLAMRHYDAQLKVAEMGAQSREEIAGIAAGSREKVADTRATATTNAAAIRAKPTVVKLLDSLQEAKDNGADEETLTALRAAAAKGGNFAPEHLTELEKYMQLRKSAQDRGDAESEGIYQKAIDKKTHLSMTAAEVEAAAAAPAPAKPAMVAPTKVAPEASSISIGGKTYPVFKDKNGKRAYKIDGHFVPIETN